MNTLIPDLSYTCYILGAFIVFILVISLELFQQYNKSLDTINKYWPGLHDHSEYIQNYDQISKFKYPFNRSFITRCFEIIHLLCFHDNDELYNAYKKAFVRRFKKHPTSYSNLYNPQKIECNNCWSYCDEHPCNLWHPREIRRNNGHLLPCGHVLCRYCLSTLIQNVCPITSCSQAYNTSYPFEQNKYNFVQRQCVSDVIRSYQRNAGLSVPQVINPLIYEFFPFGYYNRDEVNVFV